jgi:hypothetical protein
MLLLPDALKHQRPCPCACHATLSLDDRVRGIRAIYKLDDALRGMGYQPTYELHGDALFRAQQVANDTRSRLVAVRFGECIYRRLVGAMLHEVIHALAGVPGEANYGIPYGLPYGVPEDVPESEEEAFLAPFNMGEAKAWAGVWILGRHMFQVAWDVRTARDIGTYGFVGGNALVKVPKGFRAVAHIDRNLHAERYYPRGRALEAEARAFFTEHVLREHQGRLEEYARLGERKRPRAFASEVEVAQIRPEKIGRNDPCVCGSPKKYKACCGERSADVPYFEPTSVSRG